jgi:hypothetical protein
MKSSCGSEFRPKLKRVYTHFDVRAVLAGTPTFCRSKQTFKFTSGLRGFHYPPS